MSIRVANVRGLNKPEERAGVVYVGRAFAGWPGHALGNPLRPHYFASLDACLAGYRSWLLLRPTLEVDLASLWEETGHGSRPLGCWCVNAVVGDGQPVCCHAQVLAEMLHERFGDK